MLNIEISINNFLRIYSIIIVIIIVILIVLFSMFVIFPKNRPMESIYSIDNNTNISSSSEFNLIHYDTFIYNMTNRNEHILIIPKSDKNILSDKINIVNITDNKNSILYIRGDVDVRIVDKNYQDINLELLSGIGTNLLRVNKNTWQVEKYFETRSL